MLDSLSDNHNNRDHRHGMPLFATMAVDAIAGDRTTDKNNDQGAPIHGSRDRE
jgi:hypothetical protein